MAQVGSLSTLFSHSQDSGIPYVQLKSIMERKKEIEGAVEGQGNEELVEEIERSMPEGYHLVIDNLSRISKKVFLKEAAPEIEWNLVSICKERIEGRRLHQEEESIETRSRRSTEPRLALNRSHSEEYLNTFVQLLREAHENPFVNKEVLSVAHEFLFHVLVSCFKENYHSLLRVADNPHHKSMYLSLSQAYRLLSLSSEFSSIVSIEPPIKYRGILKEIKALAEQQLKNFDEKERNKLEEMFDRWPMKGSRVNFKEAA